MSRAPRTPKDLMLAPVAVEIDTNLRTLRAKPLSEIEVEILLELDRPPATNDQTERRARVLAAAVRNVDMHGWTASISEDLSAVRLAGGSVSLDLALGKTVSEYLENGAPAA